MYLKTLTPERQVSESGYRFLDPELGRWCSRDPIGTRGGINLYRFVYNSAIDHLDRLGLISCDCCHDDVMAALGRFADLAALARRLLAGRRDSDGDGIEEPCLKDIKCLPCQTLGQDVGGYYGPPENAALYGTDRMIVICCGGSFSDPSTDNPLRTLRHELQHAGDWCFDNWDSSTCKGCLCGEIRAFYCSGECADLSSCVDLIKDRGYFTSCPCSQVADGDTAGQPGYGSNLDEIEALANTCGALQPTDCQFTRPSPQPTPGQPGQPPPVVAPRPQPVRPPRRPRPSPGEERAEPAPIEWPIF